MIDAFHRNNLWSETVQIMAEYLRIYTERATQIRFKLALTLIKYEYRPDQALKVLSKLNPQLLPPKQVAVWQQLVQRAQTVAAQYPMEVADDDW